MNWIRRIKYYFMPAMDFESSLHDKVELIKSVNIYDYYFVRWIVPYISLLGLIACLTSIIKHVVLGTTEYLDMWTFVKIIGVLLLAPIMSIVFFSSRAITKKTIMEIEQKEREEQGGIL